MSRNDRSAAHGAKSQEVARRAVATGRQELRQGRSFLRRNRWRLLLLFVGVLLPLWGFAELADEVHEAEAFDFDEPLLQLAHSLARDGFDRWFLLFSAIGYAYGVVPFDIALVLALAWQRRFRESIFAASAPPAQRAQAERLRDSPQARAWRARKRFEDEARNFVREAPGLPTAKRRACGRAGSRDPRTRARGRAVCGRIVAAARGADPGAGGHRRGRSAAAGRAGPALPRRRRTARGGLVRAPAARSAPAPVQVASRMWLPKSWRWTRSPTA